MSVAGTTEHLARGYEALASGDWTAAREAFETAVEATDSPEALDGLGRALWWLREAREAVVCRERAYAGFRRDGDLARAARIALWLSREYALVFGNDVVRSTMTGTHDGEYKGIPGAGRHVATEAAHALRRNP